MKVTFFTPTAERCGIADYARFLLEHLRRDLAVEVVAAERAHRPTYYAALGRAMNEADVAHVQYEHGFFLAGGRPAESFAAFAGAIRVPTVLTLHCAPLDDARWRPMLDDATLAWVVHTRALARTLEAGGARGHVTTLLHPVPPPPLASLAGVARFRAAHHIEGRRVLTIFGFTKAHKGYDVALGALRHLSADTLLLIAGGPQDERDRATLAELLGAADRLGLGARVRVTGFVPPAEVGAALAASDVVLAPFRSTHASGSVATALAAERPVIATALDPLVEIAERAGCLRLFPSGDERALAREIDRVLGEPALRCALQAAARTFRERHGYDDLASRTRALYERSAARSGAGESL